MKKVDAVVLQETKYIVIWTVIFSVLLQGIFLLIKKWDYTVLLGNLLSGTACIANFLIMGINLTSALQKEEKEAKEAMKASSGLRSFGLFLVVAIGVILPQFNLFAVIIPLFFPRIAIAIRPLCRKEGKSKDEGKDS